MTNSLKDLINLLSNKISDIQSDAVIIQITLDEESLKQIEHFNDNLIESIKDSSGGLINIEDLSVTSQPVFIEFVTAELKKRGFYINFNDFVVDNRFEPLEDFYIQQLNYSNTSTENNKEVEKYKTLIALIQKLINKSKFVSDEDVKTLFIFQESKFIELPIDNTILYEDFLQSEDLDLIKDYIRNIDEYKEKTSIFLQELIDFLSETKTDRLQYLLSNFKEFFERCNTSFEFYLSNFSYNKVRMEIDNSVLEHSKNIRNIINDSQSKLVAIPAAFVLAATQIDFSDAFSFKNVVVVISSFIFSYIISVFIQNQKNALEIVSDNVKNFKKSFLQTKTNDIHQIQELASISNLLKKSYEKIEVELINQKRRLLILQFIGWGISLTLLTSLPVLKYRSVVASFFQHTEKSDVKKPKKKISLLKIKENDIKNNKTK